MKLLAKKEEKNIANIEATRIVQDEKFLYAYKENILVGMFAIGSFDAAFLYETEKAEK